MDEEFSKDVSYEKRTFISKLNPESPPFLPSSSHQHIQETTSQGNSSLENNNDHSHIQSTKNGHDDDEMNSYSTTIHSTELSEDIPSETHYREETTSDNQHSTTSSYHIESNDTSHNDQFEQSISKTRAEDVDNSNKISFEQTTNINDEEILNTMNNDNRLNDQSNSDTKTNSIEEFTIQEESNKNEFDISADQFSTNIERNTHSNGSETNTIDPHSSTKDEENSDDKIQQNEPEDILGNKSLLKQTIGRGTPDTRPIRNALATISYKLYIIDDSTSECRFIESIDNESFFIGESDILPAIDISIQLMDRGEHAFIYSDIRHCYGDLGCQEKQIPPKSSEQNSSYQMKIDLEFHDWKHPSDIETLSVNERLFWSDKKRQRGNFCYRRKEYSTALQCYRNALKFLDTDENPLVEELDNSSTIFIDRFIQVQNNLAQVYLFNNQYEQCLDAVNQVLKHDSKNIKALFRQAKAFFELGNYDQAIRPLKILSTNQNQDIEKDKVNDMLNICQTKLATYKKNEKEIYKRMFASSTTTNDEKLQTKQIKKIENKNNHPWWTYVAMGSAILAAVGLAAIIKYR